MTKYFTGNVSTNEYFTITEVGSLNTYIKLFDVSGFIGNKIIPNKQISKWTN